MSEFKNKSITTKGMELLAKALAGETLEFTHIEMGSGTYTGDIGEATSLIEKRQHLPITKITRKGGQVTLSTTLKLEDIKEPFNWSEIGVYAKGTGSIETLYMYGYTTNTSYISKDSLNEKLIHVTVMVSSANEVTATIDNSLVYLTLEALNEHSKNQAAHEDIREKVNHLENQLSNIDISWEGITGKPESMPANGGNADTVGGKTVNEIMTLANNELYSVYHPIKKLKQSYTGILTTNIPQKFGQFIARHDGIIRLTAYSVDSGTNVSTINVYGSSVTENCVTATLSGDSEYEVSVLDLYHAPNGTIIQNQFNRITRSTYNAGMSTVKNMTVELSVVKGGIYIFGVYGRQNAPIKLDLYYDVVTL